MHKNSKTWCARTILSRDSEPAYLIESSVSFVYVAVKKVFVAKCNQEMMAKKCLVFLQIKGIIITAE